MTVWCVVIHEIQTHTAFGVVDERCASLRQRLHRRDFCAYCTGPVSDGVQVQRCRSSIFSEYVLVDFLRNKATAIAAFVGVDMIDQTRTPLEDKMTSWAFDLLR